MYHIVCREHEVHVYRIDLALHVLGIIRTARVHIYMHGIRTRIYMRTFIPRTVYEPRGGTNVLIMHDDLQRDHDCNWH